VKRIIIDTDAGVDDALAIILALKSPELSVEAITTVAGNAEVEKCTRNCLLILDVLNQGRSPIVAKGAKKPLARALVTEPRVHGKDGLGDITHEYPSFRHRPAERDAEQVILDLVKEYPEQITIVAIGPLTNVARALQKEPRTMKKVKEIIAMGGAFQVAGNQGPVAEFNMYVDPEAAHCVFHSGVPITLLPLDVTQQGVFQRSDVVHLARKGEYGLGLFIERMTKRYMEYHEETEGFLGGYLHDPLAIAVAVKRELVRYHDLHVEVETQGEITRGMTIAELRTEREKRPPNARVGYRLKRRQFLEFFQSRVWG
jgi:inosine-uridine nucleoside N-ribohydrolase